MIPQQYDVGKEASSAFAVGIGTIKGEPHIIVSAWEDEDMQNLSCVALSFHGAALLGEALVRAANPNVPPDFPIGEGIMRKPHSGLE